MSEAHAPAAWWEDVEHLREAAERRIAERERAQREGRDPVALTPLRPLDESERSAGPSAPPTSAPQPLQPAPKVAQGRFRRNRGAGGPPAPAASGRVAAATATALAVELEHAPEPWIAEEPAGHATPLDAAPELLAPAADLAAPARLPREERSPGEERPTRREELSRLAREQAQATAAARPSTAGIASATRRTIEIRGRVEPRPVIAAVPDPRDSAESYRRARRARRSPVDAFIAQPDRIALWAFLLGLFLIVVALASAH